MLSERGLQKVLEDILPDEIKNQLSDQNKDVLIKEFSQFLTGKNGGTNLRLTNDNLKDPLMLKALVTAMVTFAQQHPDIKLNVNIPKLVLRMGLSGPSEYRNPEQLKQLETAMAEYIESKKNPDGRPASSPQEQYALMAVFDANGNVIDIMEGHFVPAGKAGVSMSSIFAEAGISPEEKLILSADDRYPTNAPTLKPPGVS